MLFSLVVTWADVQHCRNAYEGLFFLAQNLLPHSTGCLRQTSSLQCLGKICHHAQNGNLFSLWKVWWGQIGMLPALPDLWGFTAVLSSCFKKTGKRKQKVRYPFLLVPVLPVLLPTSA